MLPLLLRHASVFVNACAIQFCVPGPPAAISSSIVCADKFQLYFNGLENGNNLVKGSFLNFFARFSLLSYPGSVGFNQKMDLVERNPFLRHVLYPFFLVLFNTVD
jgi:hypothetical protein